MLILTLGNPSCHSGFVWRILTVRTEQSDLLPVRGQSLSVGIPVLLWMGRTQALAMPQTPPHLLGKLQSPAFPLGATHSHTSQMEHL